MRDCEPEVVTEVRDVPHITHVSNVQHRFTGVVVSLVSDTITINDTTVVRDVVRHPGAVAVVALRRVDEQWQILMVSQYRHPMQQVCVELPAGLRDIENEDAEDCARRELLEETGYVAGRMEVLLRSATTPGGSDEIITTFWTHDVSWQGVQQTAEAEELSMSAMWVPVEVAAAAAMTGSLCNQTAQAGIFAVTRKISYMINE